MYLLFDFDGTLVDSFRCVIEKTRLLADEFNFRRIEEEEIEGLRDLTSMQLIQTLKVPLLKIPRMIQQMRKHLHEEMKNLLPIPGVFPVLEKFHEAKIPLGILTSNAVDNVSLWLAQHNMQHLFNFIHNEANFFSKGVLLKETLKSYQIDKMQSFYIGDETRDIEAAQQNEMKSIAVTWGYNSEKTILQAKPTYIARQPTDLLRLCGLGI